MLWVVMVDYLAFAEWPSPNVIGVQVENYEIGPRLCHGSWLIDLYLHFFGMFQRCKAKCHAVTGLGSVPCLSDRFTSKIPDRQEESGFYYKVRGFPSHHIDSL